MFVAGAGRWSLWSIANIFESTRVIFFNAGFCYYEKLHDQDHSFYVVNTTYHLTHAANKLRASIHWGKYSPIFGTVRIVYVGKSSFTFDTILYDYKTGAQLCSLLLTFVYIDKNTRRSAQFPEWVREAASKLSFLRDARPPDRLEDIPVAPRAHKYTTKALHSDIDGNGHVNQAVFIRWCSDAEIDAVSKNVYRGFKEDTDIYYIEKIEVKYVREGLVNEQYVVETWQDGKSPLIIHFVISKDNDTVFVARFTYGSGSQVSNL